MFDHVYGLLVCFMFVFQCWVVSVAEGRRVDVPPWQFWEFPIFLASSLVIVFPFGTVSLCLPSISIYVIDHVLYNSNDILRTYFYWMLAKQKQKLCHPANVPTLESSFAWEIPHKRAPIKQFGPPRNQHAESSSLFATTDRIHLWYIYLHLPLNSAKCR